MAKVIGDNHEGFANEKAIISFDSISLRMLKYYWNQLFFFKLKQSPYKDKDPVICQDTERLIEAYKQKENTNIPIWFDDAQKYFNKNGDIVLRFYKSFKCLA